MHHGATCGSGASVCVCGMWCLGSVCVIAVIVIGASPRIKRKHTQNHLGLSSSIVSPRTHSATSKHTSRRVKGECSAEAHHREDQAVL